MKPPPGQTPRERFYVNRFRELESLHFWLTKSKWCQQQMTNQTIDSEIYCCRADRTEDASERPWVCTAHKRERSAKQHNLDAKTGRYASCLLLFCQQEDIGVLDDWCDAICLESISIGVYRRGWKCRNTQQRKYRNTLVVIEEVGQPPLSTLVYTLLLTDRFFQKSSRGGY